MEIATTSNKDTALAKLQLTAHPSYYEFGPTLGCTEGINRRPWDRYLTRLEIPQRYQTLWIDYETHGQAMAAYIRAKRAIEKSDDETVYRDLKAFHEAE